eukprot:SAG11_NODE_2614_length_3170_cov_2.584500_1_plen_64_part_00
MADYYQRLEALNVSATPAFSRSNGRIMLAKYGSDARTGCISLRKYRPIRVFISQTFARLSNGG